MKKPESQFGPAQSEAAGLLGEKVAEILRRALTESLTNHEQRRIRSDLKEIESVKRYDSSNVEQPRQFENDSYLMTGSDCGSYIDRDLTPEIAKRSWNEGRRKGYYEGVADILGHLVSLSYKRPQ